MNPFVRGVISLTYTGGAAARNAIASINAIAASSRAAAAASAASSAAAQRQRISFMEMMRMMVVFGVGLQLINAMMLPGKWLYWGIKSSMEFQQGMARVNTVLGATKQELKALGDSSLLLGNRMGMTQEQITDGLYNIGQSISAIKLDGMTRAQASLELLNEAQRLAKTSNVELNVATEGLMRTMASMGFGMKDVREIAGLLFQTINVGIISGDELNRNIGDITSSLSFLTTKMSEVEKKNVTKQMLSLWSALSQTIPASEAATSVNVFMNSLIKGSDEAMRLMNEFRTMFGVDITMEAFLKKGPRQYFEDLFGVIKDNGPLMNYIQGQMGALNNLQGDNAKMTAIQVQVLGTLFGNIRALRGVLAAGGDDLRVWNEAMGEFSNAATAYEKAVQEMVGTAMHQWDRLFAFFQTYSMKTFGPGAGPLGGLFDGLADIFEYTLNQFDFEDLSFGQKIKRLLENMNRTLVGWWNTGGKKDWQTIFHSMGFEITNMLISLVTGRGIFGEMGAEAAKAFAGGFKDRIIEAFTSGEIFQALTGPLVRAAIFTGLLGWKRGSLAFAGSEAIGMLFNGLTGGAGEGSGIGDFVGEAGKIGFGLLSFQMLSNLLGKGASKAGAGLNVIRSVAGAAGTYGATQAAAGAGAARASIGAGAAFLAPALGTPAIGAGAALGILGYYGLGKLLGAKDFWWGYDIFEGKWKGFGEDTPNAAPMAATPSSAQSVHISVNFDKVADTIEFADKRQVKEITNAVAKGLTEGLRKAGLDVVVQPAAV